VALLRANPLDADTAAATVVFAVGQLRDTLTSAGSIVVVESSIRADRAHRSRRRARKMKTAGARTVLSRFLSVTERIARMTRSPRAPRSVERTRSDITSIVKWTTSPSDELRWRAVWALFRPRDPAAVATPAMSDESGRRSIVGGARTTRAQADSATLARKLRRACRRGA
jgi:hypothetical protein